MQGGRSLPRFYWSNSRTLSSPHHKSLDSPLPHHLPPTLFSPHMIPYTPLRIIHKVFPIYLSLIRLLWVLLPVSHTRYPRFALIAWFRERHSPRHPPVTYHHQHSASYIYSIGLDNQKSKSINFCCQVQHIEKFLANKSIFHLADSSPVLTGQNITRCHVSISLFRRIRPPASSKNAANRTRHVVAVAISIEEKIQAKGWKESYLESRSDR